MYILPLLSVERTSDHHQCHRNFIFDSKKYTKKYLFIQVCQTPIFEREMSS
ncbi:hypothetical protein DsansV1_C34g0225391 [Dioscorea sansibarensis]